MESTISLTAGGAGQARWRVEVGESGEIRVIPVDGALARAQRLLAPYLPAARSLADKLIAERQLEARGE